jgi:hypothetical protein
MNLVFIDDMIKITSKMMIKWCENFINERKMQKRRRERKCCLNLEIVEINQKYDCECEREIAHEGFITTRLLWELGPRLMS